MLWSTSVCEDFFSFCNSGCIWSGKSETICLRRRTHISTTSSEKLDVLRTKSRLTIIPHKGDAFGGVGRAPTEAAFINPALCQRRNHFVLFIYNTHRILAVDVNLVMYWIDRYCLYMGCSCKKSAVIFFLSHLSLSNFWVGHLNTCYITKGLTNYSTTYMPNLL